MGAERSETHHTWCAQYGQEEEWGEAHMSHVGHLIELRSRHGQTQEALPV